MSEVPEHPIDQPRAAIAETQRRHCRAPATCSVCLQAAGALPVPVQRVDVMDGGVFVDGRKVRDGVEREYGAGERFRGRG